MRSLRVLCKNQKVATGPELYTVQVIFIFVSNVRDILTKRVHRQYLIVTYFLMCTRKSFENQGFFYVSMFGFSFKFFLNVKITSNKSAMVLATHHLYDSFVGDGTRIQVALRRDTPQTDLTAVVTAANKHFSRIC